MTLVSFGTQKWISSQTNLFHGAKWKDFELNNFAKYLQAHNLEGFEMKEGKIMKRAFEI